MIRVFNGSIYRFSKENWRNFTKDISRNEEWGLGEDFCIKLKSEVLKGGDFLKDLIIPYEVSKENYSSKRLSNPCVLSHKNHRIVISTDPSNRNSSNNYPNYFSCLLSSGAFYCKFEDK